MKKLKAEPKIKAASIILMAVVISMSLIGTTHYVTKTKAEEENNNVELLLSDNILNESAENISDTTELNDENNANVEEIVYDGLTRQELIDKLNRNMNSTIAGKGELFADYALELGLDPYLALAIVLHETGCSWDCSTLVKTCNNVGGQKGNPGCGNGSYMAYPTLDDGIRGYMDNLYKNFYALGLTTPETINPKYASSTTWASKINYYIEKIRAS